MVEAVSVWPKALMKRAPGNSWMALLIDFQGHGRPAVGDHVQGGQVEVVEPGMVHQLLEHGGDDHGPVDPALLHQGQPLQRVELAHDHHGAAAVDRRQDSLEPGDVVQGHGEQVAFLNVRVRRGHRGQQVGREAVVGQHHPLGRAGGACSEHNDGGIAVVRLGEEEFVVGSFRPAVLRSRRPPPRNHRPERPRAPEGLRGGGQQRQVTLPDEHDAGLGLGQHLGQFFFFGAEVDGNVTRRPTGRRRNRPRWPGGSSPASPLPGRPYAYAQAGHGVGQTIGPELEFGEGKGSAVKYYGGAVGHDGAGYGKKFGSPHCVLKRLDGQHGFGLQRLEERQVGPPLQGLLGRGGQPGV